VLAYSVDKTLVPVNHSIEIFSDFKIMKVWQDNVLEIKGNKGKVVPVLN
jgi:hypothetical protein